MILIWGWWWELRWRKRLDEPREGTLHQNWCSWWFGDVNCLTKVIMKWRRWAAGTVDQREAAGGPKLRQGSSHRQLGGPSEVVEGSEGSVLTPSGGGEWPQYMDGWVGGVDPTTPRPRAASCSSMWHHTDCRGSYSWCHHAQTGFKSTFKQVTSSPVTFLIQEIMTNGCSYSGFKSISVIERI